jgi:amidase
MAAEATTEEARSFEPVRRAAIERHAALCHDGAILAVPAATSVAPPLDTPFDQLPALRTKTLAVGIVPTLVGAPSVSLPLATVDGLPVNLALIGALGSDETLLDLAAALD